MCISLLSEEQHTLAVSFFPLFFISFLLSRTSALCTRGLPPLPLLAAAYPGGVCMCACATQSRCVCVCDRFPKPVVIGESLQRIPASSLVAALAGNGGRRLVSGDTSWSRACQKLLVIVCVVRGDSSPADGRRHPSTSPWRVIPALLGIRKLLRGESKFSSQIIKSPVEVKKPWEWGGGLRG